MKGIIFILILLVTLGLASCRDKKKIEVSKEDFKETIYGRWRNVKNTNYIISGNVRYVQDVFDANGFSYEISPELIKFYSGGSLLREDNYLIYDQVENCAGNSYFPIESEAIIGSTIGIDISLHKEGDMLQMHLCYYDTGSGDPHWVYLIQDYEKE